MIFPGGFGTMDELFESLTLIQTEKVRDFPVVLFGKEYWGGLFDWIAGTMLPDEKISSHDLDRFIVTDSTTETVEYLVHHCARNRAEEAAARHRGRGAAGGAGASTDVQAHDPATREAGGHDPTAGD